MVSRRKFNNRSRCRVTHKDRFPNELEAKIVLAKLKWKDKGQKRVYRCHMCKGYHLTSQEQKS